MVQHWFKWEERLKISTGWPVGRVIATTANGASDRNLELAAGAMRSGALFHLCSGVEREGGR
jgi:hypothetical protein